MDPLDRMFGDATPHLAQVVLGIEAVELRRLGQGVDRRDPLAASIRAARSGRT